MIDKKNENAVMYCKALSFNASDKQLSPVLINSLPYFVAVEVCEILELGNTSEAIRRLDDDEKLTSVLMRSGQNREVNLVNESGLYSLIFQSRKPAAKLFRKWVTSEVLPSLRRTGKYEVKTVEPTEPPKLLPKRNHNRITRERMVSILADVCRIDNSELRASLTAKLMGGHAV
jgi:prophage antirepressor-like protein